MPLVWLILALNCLVQPVYKKETIFVSIFNDLWAVRQTGRFSWIFRSIVLLSPLVVCRLCLHTRYSASLQDIVRIIWSVDSSFIINGDVR